MSLTRRYGLKRPETRGEPSFDAVYPGVLNEEQRRAVTAGDGPLLVVAGAGSGKTRTLIYRLAWLVRQGIPPESILLLTFTRRAALEMQRRAASLLDERCHRVTGGTFHSVAAMLLRQEGNRMGLSAGFTILDRSDGEDAINFLRGRSVSGTRTSFPRKGTLAEIFSKCQNKLVTLEEVLTSDYPHLLGRVEAIQAVMRDYAAYKRERSLLDYDDLLVYLYTLLLEHDGARKKISDRYRHILVDEYQDTNRIQGEIVRLLGTRGNVTAVGDDAQSIYAFRGARHGNMMDFPRAFPGTTILRLEENFRSTQPVLDLANAIMAQAEEKYAKRLFSRRGSGPIPALVAAGEEADQSGFVAQRIAELLEEGIPLREIAVLFRSSFHAFDLEVELARRGIPFVKRGGFRFSETAHVKDVLAHLRVHLNPKDAVSWHRLLLLIDGIGPRTAARLVERILGDPRGPAAPDPVGVLKSEAGKHRTGLGSLADLFAALQGLARPSEQAERVMAYYLPLLRGRYDDHPKRTKDLEHLLVMSERYRSLGSFLNDLALEPSAGALESGKDDEEERLTLSTIHSAKGLEWKAVFILWVLDGYFPSLYSFNRMEELEEERRLLYVAVTRAKDLLYLLYPIRVFDRGTRSYLTRPSRFVASIPEGTLECWAAVSEEEASGGAS